MEEKGTSPERSWMDELKGASGTAFLSTLFIYLAGSFADECLPTG